MASVLCSQGLGAQNFSGLCFRKETNRYDAQRDRLLFRQ
jgi:hypothetical protein